MDPSFLNYGFIVYIVKSDNHNDNDDEYGRVATPSYKQLIPGSE